VAKSTGTYLPGRRGDDHLQVVTVINFKGGLGRPPLQHVLRKTWHSIGNTNLH